MDFVYQALHYLVRVVPFAVLGIFLMQLIVALKWVEKISWITKPITGFANLRRECGMSFLAAFGSPAAANSILAGLEDDGLIGGRELTIAALANSFPVTVMHWRYMLPVLIPLLGAVGLTYFGILACIGLSKTMIVLVLGRFLLESKENGKGDIERNSDDRPSLREAVRTAVNESKPTLKRILALIIPTTFAVFLAIDLGAFDALGEALKCIAPYLPVPAEGLTVIAAQFARGVAAYTVAGNLLNTGVLTGKGVILALLTGGILTTPVKVRYTVPYYVGIFGSRKGFEILALSQILRIGLRILAILMVIFIF